MTPNHNNLLTPALIERCHAGSRAKGFWESVSDQRQQLMLVISELAEALEAHRKGLVSNWSRYNYACKSLNRDFDQNHFEQALKDSPGDELADAFIRGCDFAGGFGLQESVSDGYRVERAGNRFIPENFGAALYTITDLLAAVSYENGSKLNSYKLGAALAAIERLADREGIDLATHIDLKLRYNATRNRLHGKAY